MKYFPSPTLMVLFCAFLVITNDAKMILKTFENCQGKDYLLSYNVTTYFENDDQLVDANATFKRAFSNDLKILINIELSLAGRLVPVIRITERHACNAYHKYLGEMAYDLERSASLAVGLYPIPKGKYRVNHHLINFDKMTLRGLPLGVLHFNISVLDQHGIIVSCLKGVIQHV